MALPGLAKPNFASARPIKTDIGQSLRAQPAATGTTTRAAITSSVSGSTTGKTAKLDQSTTAGFFGVSFAGVKAQRTNRLFGNVKVGYGMGISNLRHALISEARALRYEAPVMQPKLQQANNDYMNSYMKMMEMQAFTKSIGDLTAGGIALANALKSNNSNKTTDTPDNKSVPDEKKVGKNISNGILIPEYQQYIDAMNNAKDSTELQAAINNAETQKDGIQPKIDKANEDKLELENNNNDLKTKNKELKEKKTEDTTKKNDLQKQYSKLQTAKVTIQSLMAKQKSGNITKEEAKELNKLTKEYGDINSIENNMANISKNMISLGESIATCDAKINANNTQIRDNNTQIEICETDVNNYTTTQETMTQNIAEAQIKLETMQAQEAAKKAGGVAAS